jgi:N-acetylneuraminic acid mutarotase
VDWVNETDTAPWSVRRPNLAVHGGKLWILGGDALDVGVSPFDVWYSEDGKDWLQAPTPPWMGLARRSFSVVVFQNRLWVFGGLVTTAEDGQFASRDVWASDDGLEWELVTDSAPWYGRSDAGVTVHDGRIWLCGGSSRYGLMDDVWYTEDGVHWVNPLPPMWEKRYAHGAAVFQDEMWIMGGDNGDKRFNDVWHSADGLAWTQAADAGWAPRRGLGVAVLNDALYVAGGQDGKTEGAHYYNDVWCSEDGETWQELTAAAPWSSRGFGKLLVFQDKLWMLGGEHRGSTLRDIWSSNDGVIWSLEMDQAPWPRIQSAAAAVHKGRIYTSDGWASGDGITWEEILGRDSTYRLPILLSNAGRLWYFSGLYYIDEPEWHYNYAVRSSLGNYWEIVARNLSLTDREAAAGLVFKGSLWMLGGSGEFDRPRNDIWRSSGVPANHAADTDGDDTIGLSELLRAVQFYSLGGYACDPMGEDGYGVTTTDHHCTPHSSDYNPQDWKLNLGELLRLIQIFNIGGYYLCDDGEDGFCPGPGVGEE